MGKYIHSEKSSIDQMDEYERTDASKYPSSDDITRIVDPSDDTSEGSDDSK
jgi:hypothetical protein